MDRSEEIRHQYFQLSRRLYEAISMGLSNAEIEELKMQVAELHEQLKAGDNRDPASLIRD